ncbi:hypothetical protein [Agarivorans sp. DSG3-1]|uniref:hypothetical protein n=1 Tax=Agarivorans sp. DSG3-1 TaxID=3342249 RepID=UPI00398E5208
MLPLNIILTLAFILSSGLLSGTLQAKTITLATSKSIPPYIIKNSQSGIQLDIIKQAFELAGHQVDQVIFTSNIRAEKMLKQQAVDAIVNAPNTVQHSFLSDPVIFYHNVAISLSSQDVDLQQISQLAKYKLLAFQNAKKYLGEQYANAVAHAKSYTEVANQYAQLERLYRGQVDVIIMDKRIFAYLNKQRLKEKKTVEEVRFHTIFEPSPRLLGFHQAALRDQFNLGLKRLNDQRVKDSE